LTWGGEFTDSISPKLTLHEEALSTLTDKNEESYQLGVAHLILRRRRERQPRDASSVKTSRWSGMLPHDFMLGLVWGSASPKSSRSFFAVTRQSAKYRYESTGCVKDRSGGSEQLEAAENP
jgi:hypothetical protein